MAYIQADRQQCDKVVELVNGKDSVIVQQWRGLVGKWEGSGWTISRNERDQLVGQGVEIKKCSAYSKACKRYWA
jgi:hypothetical protein